MAELVNVDGEAENEEESNQRYQHTESLTDLCAQSSAALISSRSGLCFERCRAIVLLISSGIRPNLISPSRNKFTAVSLALLSTAGIVPPVRRAW
jgi:hypothetical protein